IGTLLDCMLEAPTLSGARCCCARATSGHVIAEPAKTLMKSRRRITALKAQGHADTGRLHQGFATSEMGSMINLRCKHLGSPMSVLCQKQTLRLLLDIIVGGQGCSSSWSITRETSPSPISASGSVRRAPGHVADRKGRDLSVTASAHHR